ncbi:Acetolactate synthase small subunit [Geodia barretti]|uniref:Acetolactate synthase small subunit n=1 Tax=Geodia barretti TaxID=519541 RepID=A0AA35R578_GEOBA|nr:Acetolactate synthase small subunit [Geodia barretti]
MFRRRGFNIASLAVGRSEKQGLFSPQESFGRVKRDLTTVSSGGPGTGTAEGTTSPSTRGEIMQFAELFSANIVDVGSTYVVIEITGGEQKVDALENLLRPFGITDVKCRTHRKDIEEEEEMANEKVLLLDTTLRDGEQSGRHLT